MCPFSLNVSDTILNQTRANATEDEKEEESTFNFPDQLSWPTMSGARPAGNEVAGEQRADGRAFDNSDDRLSNGLTGIRRPGEDSARLDTQADIFDDHRPDALSNQDHIPDPWSVPDISVEGLDEEAADGVRTYPDYVSPDHVGNDRATRRDFSWCKPNMSFGFIALIGIVLVVPAMIVVLAFVLPRYEWGLAPKPNYTTPEEDLEALLTSVSLDNGTAMNTASTPQNQAYNWLLNNTDIDRYGDMQIKQRYALAVLFFSTGGNNAWYTNDGWLSVNESECSVWFHRYTGEFCKSGALVDLDLSNNNLRGTLPDELTILSGSLSK